MRAPASAIVEGLFWAGLGTTLLAFILFGHLPEGLVWPKAFDVVHAVLSGTVALVVLRLSRRLFLPGLPGSLSHYAIALSFVGVLGAGIEVAQMFTHDDPSLEDFARDISGALAALACATSLDPMRVWCRGPWVRWGLRLAAAAISIVVAFPLLRTEWQLHERAAMFPRLADFEPDSEEPFISTFGAILAWIEPPTEFALAKGHAARVTFAEIEEYPKLEICAIGDWSKDRALVFDVYSDTPSMVSLSVRIDDQRGGHFNTHLVIPPGQSTQRVSVEDIRTAGDSALDLAHMRALLLFLHKPRAPTVLTFDSVRLER